MKYTQLSLVVYLNEVEELWEKKHGCRISEVWSLFPEEGSIADCVIINKSKKASLYKYAIALTQENIEKFDLFNIHRNHEYKTPEEYDVERAKTEGYAMA